MISKIAEASFVLNALELIKLVEFESGEVGGLQRARVRSHGMQGVKQ
jgi:hypothetical protein